MKATSNWPLSGPDSEDERTDIGRTVLIEPPKPELQIPKRYQVVMINDDYTPMEFVIEVLELFFGLTGEHATRLMLQVHHMGKAGIGSYSRDVAETKAAIVVDYARQHEHPLLCLVEPVL
jgi:ATP-dependent Clp protease adaptor protein ClpS